MTLTKLKSGRLTFVVAVVILTGLLGYALSRKPVIKEIPALYKVAAVIDGDTIQVELNSQIERVRFIGVNTPEVIPEECFGKEATDKTRELLKNKEVYLIPDPESSDRDKYGRLLRYVFLPDGKFVNAELVQKGYAFNYIYEPFQFMKQFDFLEKQAKENRLGLWSEECDYYFEIYDSRN
jgi:micrococcal nuclease